MQFVGVKVWPQPHEQFEGQNIASFDFNEVEIGEISETYLLTNEDDPLFYGVMLHIVIENKRGKIAPYDINVRVVGHFKIKKSIAKEERADLVTVNGCSMLYGAIREQVMTLSARSVHGMLILPTVSFQDKVKKDKNISQDSELAKPRKATRIVKKKISE
ncbi:MAG: protein-export chaperone SecB [Saprospiraceae bacterium]|nr:protein-export chaperone SecB [Candidatus Brachybacter algidus]